jgi:DinB family protein
MPEAPRDPRLEAANDREACRAQLAANRDAARALFEGRTEAQLLWKPAPGAWSIAECMLHLNRAGRVYLGAIDRALGEGRRRGLAGDGPYRHPWFSRWFVASLEAPAKMRFKAPKIFAPAAAPAGSGRAILEEFQALGGDVGERLDASRGLDLGRVRVVSPVTPLVRLSLGMAFSLLATHERRHLDQARRVAAQLPAAAGSPRGS